jgi:hypothetical protein
MEESPPPPPPPRMRQPRRRRQYLPADALDLVFQFLTMRDVPTLVLVCRRWNERVNEDSLWIRFADYYRLQLPIAAASIPSGSGLRIGSFSRGVQPILVTPERHSATVREIRGSGTVKELFHQLWQERVHRRGKGKGNSTRSAALDPSTPIRQGGFSAGLAFSPMSPPRETIAVSSYSPNSPATAPSSLWVTPRQSLDSELSSLQAIPDDPTTAIAVSAADTRLDVFRRRLTTAEAGIQSLHAPIRSITTVDETLLEESRRHEALLRTLNAKVTAKVNALAARKLHEARFSYAKLVEESLVQAVLWAETEGAAPGSNASDSFAPPPFLSTLFQLELYCVSESMFGSPLSLRWSMLKRSFPIDDAFFDVLDFLRSGEDAIEVPPQYLEVMMRSRTEGDDGRLDVKGRLESIGVFIDPTQGRWSLTGLQAPRPLLEKMCMTVLLRAECTRGKAQAPIAMNQLYRQLLTM